MITTEDEEAAYDIIQHNSYFNNSPRISSQNRKSRKGNKIINIWKEEIKFSVFADDKIIYIGNSEKSSPRIKLMKNSSQL